MQIKAYIHGEVLLIPCGYLMNSQRPQALTARMHVTLCVNIQCVHTLE